MHEAPRCPDMSMSIGQATVIAAKAACCLHLMMHGIACGLQGSVQLLVEPAQRLEEFDRNAAMT